MGYCERCWYCSHDKHRVRQEGSPFGPSDQGMTEGQKASSILMQQLEEKFAYYMKTYGWTVKGNPEGTLRKFFEWGFIDGVSLGIDLGKKAALGEPLLS